MFPEHRQEVLNPILDALRQVPGISSVQQDDFDSSGINVFLQLAGTKYKLDQPLAVTKKRIGKVIKDITDRGFAFLDQPEKTRTYNGKDFAGKAIYFDNGYSHRHIKIDIFV